MFRVLRSNTSDPPSRPPTSQGCRSHIANSTRANVLHCVETDLRRHARPGCCAREGRSNTCTRHAAAALRPRRGPGRKHATWRRSPAIRVSLPIAKRRCAGLSIPTPPTHWPKPTRERASARWAAVRRSLRAATSAIRRRLGQSQSTTDVVTAMAPLTPVTMRKELLGTPAAYGSSSAAS